MWIGLFVRLYALRDRDRHAGWLKAVTVLTSIYRRGGGFYRDRKVASVFAISFGSIFP